MKHSASSIDQISELLDLPVDNAKYITQMLHPGRETIEKETSCSHQNL